MLGGDAELRKMAAEQYQKKSMVKNDVTDFGLGKDHFNEYMIYKRGEGGDDIDGWTVEEMKSAIAEYNKFYGGEDDAIPLESDRINKA